MLFLIIVKEDKINNNDTICILKADDLTEGSSYEIWEKPSILMSWKLYSKK